VETVFLFLKKNIKVCSENVFVSGRTTMLLGEIDLKVADRRVLRKEFSCTVQLVTGLADKLCP